MKKIFKIIKNIKMKRRERIFYETVIWILQKGDSVL